MKQSEFIAKMEIFLKENGVVLAPHIESMPQFEAGINPNQKYSEAKYMATNLKVQFVTRFDE